MKSVGDVGDARDRNLVFSPAIPSTKTPVAASQKSSREIYWLSLRQIPGASQLQRAIFLLQAAVESGVSFSRCWVGCHAVEEHALTLLFWLEFWFATGSAVCLPLPLALALALALELAGVARSRQGPELLASRGPARRAQPLSHQLTSLWNGLSFVAACAKPQLFPGSCLLKPWPRRVLVVGLYRPYEIVILSFSECNFTVLVEQRAYSVLDCSCPCCLLFSQSWPSELADKVFGLVVHILLLLYKYYILHTLAVVYTTV